MYLKNVLNNMPSVFTQKIQVNTQKTLIPCYLSLFYISYPCTITFVSGIIFVFTNAAFKSNLNYVTQNTSLSLAFCKWFIPASILFRILYAFIFSHSMLHVPLYPSLVSIIVLNIQLFFR
jgi:hypothetical protein